jgi:hypothetical protein
MNEILKVLDTKGKKHPGADVRELSCSVAAAYVAGDYEGFLVESRKLNRIYKALEGIDHMPDAGNMVAREQEGWEVGSDHK